MRLSNMERINIDPTNVEMGWIIDFCLPGPAQHHHGSGHPAPTVS